MRSRYPARPVSGVRSSWATVDTNVARSLPAPGAVEFLFGLELLRDEGERHGRVSGEGLRQPDARVGRALGSAKAKPSVTRPDVGTSTWA